MMNRTLASHVNNAESKIREKIFHEDHPDIATSFNNIGSAYYSLGDYSKTLEYNQKSQQILEKIFQEDHPSMALVYNNIGMACVSLGDYNKSLEYYQKSLQIRENLSRSSSRYCIII